MAAVLRIDRAVHAEVSAPPERCLAVLADVGAYPSWSSLIAAAEVLDGGRVLLRVELLGQSLEMRCELEVGEGHAVLRRVPNDPDDEERFVAAWTVRPAGAGVEVELRVEAAIDVPGAARLLRGRIERRLADDLLADFARAV
jgi:hypothetical protein